MDGASSYYAINPILNVELDNKYPSLEECIALFKGQLHKRIGESSSDYKKVQQQKKALVFVARNEKKQEFAKQARLSKYDKISKLNAIEAKKQIRIEGIQAKVAKFAEMKAQGKL